MPLTDTSIRNAKARAKPYKLGDSGGLFLLIQPSGGKLWRLKYRVDGREKKLGLGTYPEISLADARKRRDEAREVLANGKDPSREKQQAKRRAKAAAADTFGEIASEYIAKRRREGLSETTADKSEYYVKRLGPAISRLPVSEITPSDLLTELRRIEVLGNFETAKRTLQLAGRVFRYAVATARLVSDPSRDLRGALTAPQPKHLAAITEAEQVGALLRAIDGYNGQPVTKLAMKLTPHVFVRPGELRHAEWHEVDLEAAVWTIPSGKMKMRMVHQVPLSKQAIDLFRQLHAITGPEGYVFPSIRSRARPMSENTVTAALRRLGYTGDEMTAHGFRATASTLLNESSKWNPDAIERALSHKERDRVRAAYHRGPHWKERVEMAQWWSDYLDQLRKGADILSFPERAASA